MTRTRLAVLLALSLAAFACKDPAAGVPSATVGEPSTAAGSGTAAAGTGTGAEAGTGTGAAAEAGTGTGAAAQAGTGTGAAAPGSGSAALAPGQMTFNLTPANTTFAWVGSKVTRSHEGTFQQFQGTLDVDMADLTKTRVALTFQIASLTTDHPDLQAHLQSPELLDAAAFPVATFTSTSFAPITGEAVEGYTHTVVGDLNLHGVTKSISFPIRVGVTPTSVTANSEFAINRQDFGITYPGRPDDLIRDNVVIRFAITLPRG